MGKNSRVDVDNCHQVNSFLKSLLPEAYRQLDPRNKALGQMVLEASIIPPTNQEAECCFAIYVSMSGEATLYGVLPQTISIRNQLEALRKKDKNIKPENVKASRIIIRNTPELRHIVTSIMKQRIEVVIPNGFWMHSSVYCVKFETMAYELEMTFFGENNVDQRGIHQLLDRLIQAKQLLENSQQSNLRTK